MYVRGNKTHRSQTMELHNEGLQYLRSYLKSHPSVEDPFSTVSDEPLWIKQRKYSCTQCGKTGSAHEREDEDACNSYEPEQVEEVGYRSFYKAFKQSVEKSSIERNVKPKYFRKSMLTRLSAEGIGYEQLNNFARWQPGSNQAAHYVSLSNDKLREWVRDKFKEGTEENSKIIECHNCGSRNNAERLECKKCHRPLNAPKSEKMKKAKKIADRLSDFDDEKLDRIEQNIEILENPQELIREEVQKAVKEQT